MTATKLIASIMLNVGAVVISYGLAYVAVLFVVGDAPLEAGGRGAIVFVGTCILAFALIFANMGMKRAVHNLIDEASHD